VAVSHDLQLHGCLPARHSHHARDTRGLGRGRGAPGLIGSGSQPLTPHAHLRIESIADHVDLVPTIAAWHWAEWGHTDPGGSLERWTSGLGGRVGRHVIPTTLVAFLAGEAVGSVALVEYDMAVWRQYSPWLSGMYVVAKHRGRGIGSALLAACEEEAAALGVRALYLYTHSAEDFYRRYGWTVVARDVYGAERVAIMSKLLQDSRSVRNRDRPRTR
jgi:GNAT superfamily N-acetyltransferase